MLSKDQFLVMCRKRGWKIYAAGRASAARALPVAAGARGTRASAHDDSGECFEGFELMSLVV